MRSLKAASVLGVLLGLLMAVLFPPSSFRPQQPEASASSESHVLTTRAAEKLVSLASTPRLIDSSTRAPAFEEVSAGSKFQSRGSLFTAKVTSVTYLEDRNVLNLEGDGDVGPYGTVGVTATFMRPIDEKGTTGEYSALGATFRPDGKVVEFSSHGVWKSLGKHRWEIKTIGFNTEGERTIAVGVLELKSMTFKGSIYDLN